MLIADELSSVAFHPDLQSLYIANTCDSYGASRCTAKSPSVSMHGVRRIGSEAEVLAVGLDYSPVNPLKPFVPTYTLVLDLA
jgi:hypothetical protein